MLDIKTIVAGPVGTNCYIIHTASKALIIDPGGAGALLLQESAAYDVAAVVCTHGHADHFMGYPSLQEAGIPLWIGEKDADMLCDASKNLSYFSGSMFALDSPADRLLYDGDIVELDALRFQVIELPGHTTGSIGLYGEGVLFGGDVLFHESIGRTDLPGGDFPTLKATIQKRLFTLPDRTRVLPGHGPETTIAYEKAHNPFVRMD